MDNTAKLANAILGYLITGGGSESISYLHRNLRTDGWRNLGVLADFENTCRSLGFLVREGRNSRGQHRTEVAL
jgi:hypothetical protein